MGMCMEESKGYIGSNSTVKKKDSRNIDRIKSF